MHRYIYKKTDFILAFLISLLLLFVGYGSLKYTLVSWGDDHSAYLAEAIAIADGEFQKQIKTNYIIHPTQIPSEVKDGKLVYVWGYPLLLSLIYKITGFDRINYSSLFWYKIPVLFGFSAMGGVLYLFYRKRFSCPTAFLMALLFCLTPNIIYFTNEISPDLLCLFFSILIFFFSEKYMSYLEDIPKHLYIPSFIYGLILWFMYELRLNGFTVCITAFIGQMFIMIKNKYQMDRKKIFMLLFPYIIAAVITFFTEKFLFASATQNISDYSRTYSYMFTRHLNQQLYVLSDYIKALFAVKHRHIVYIVLVLAFLGLWKGIKFDLHLVLFMFGTWFFVAALPYTQGLRYLFNALPIFFLLIGYGVQFLGEVLSSIIDKVKPSLAASFSYLGQGFSSIILLICLFSNFIPLIKNDIENLKRNESYYLSEPYSESAIEIYQFIQRNLPENTVIAFRKPRALYLNTLRTSIKPGINGHTVSDADYFLFDKNGINDAEPDKNKMRVIFENTGFILYQNLPRTARDEEINEEMLWDKFE